jgi:ACS family hexuronate transporter-like MFS transporter
LGILRTAALTLSAYVLVAVFRFAMGLMLPGLSSEFHLSPAEAGVFASAPLLAGILTTAAAGYLFDRIGKRLALTIGSLMLWSGSLLSSFSPTYILALFFIFVAGAGAGFLIPGVYSIMGTIRPSSRASLAGITASSYNFGGFVGSIGLGVAIAFAGWRFGLGALSALGLIHLVIMFLFMEPSLSSHGGRREGGSSSSYLALLKSKNAILAGAVLFMGNYAGFAITSWTPTYLIHIGFSSSLTGVVIGAYSLAGALAAAICGRLADVWSERRIILFTGAMGGIVCIPLYLYRLEFGLVVILMVLLGFLLWPYWNLSTSMAQRLVNSAAVGSITGLVQTFGMVGGFLGPFFTGFLIKYFGIEAGILVSAVFSLWSYALLVIPFREAKR